MRKSGTLLLALALIAGTAGCDNLRGRTVAHPGPAPFQQKVAERFDPYPSRDVAPEIVGGRPLEYSQPRTEAAQARRGVPGVRLPDNPGLLQPNQ